MLPGHIYSQSSQGLIICLSLLLGYIIWAPAMEKLHGHVSSHLDILSLENRCLTMLPDLHLMEKPHGSVSAHPEILSLKNRCLATLPDLKTMEKQHGHVSAHPDILSLENRCLATLPVLKSTVSASPLLQRLQIPHLQVDLCSLNTSNHLLSEPPPWRAQCLSEGLSLLTCPRALKSISATERVQEPALVIAQRTPLDSSHVCAML